MIDCTLPRPTIRGMRPKSGVRPDERPFDWRATLKGPAHLPPGSEKRRKAILAELGRQVRRMKDHPPVARWTGDYPDAPPAGDRPGPSLDQHTGPRWVWGHGYRWNSRPEVVPCACDFCEKARAA